MILCPCCDSSQVTGDESVYGLDTEIMYCECRECGKGFDIRVTWEGVELAPVFYVPNCTCAAYAEAVDCRCTACQELAATDDCFEVASEVRDCGRRVAEHEHAEVAP